MARDHLKAEKLEALDVALRSLFRGLEARALPDSLRSDSSFNLLDQLRGATPGRSRRPA
jgi:hypothetical protein